MEDNVSMDWSTSNMVDAETKRIRTQKTCSVLIKVYGVLLLISAVCTVISFVNVNELLVNATHVNGQVVEISRGAKGRRAPIVRFTTTAGETLQLRSDLYTSPAPNVGDTVKVIYRTSNPRDWRIEDWIHLYFWTMMGSIFTVCWAIAIFVIKVVERRQLKACT